ncbi:MAG: hypothetical protein MJ106_07350, partial [Lentisphaeria bacterium]|nr:hypothetical protein [Lentisphaeria bacterium]
IYDIKWNEKRISEISLEILRQVKVQEDEYTKKLEERNKEKSSGYGMNGPMGGPPMGMMDDMYSETPKDDVPEYKLDIARIQNEIEKKFGKGGDELDLTVDLRNKVEIQEEAMRIVSRMPEFQKDLKELEAQEIKDAEEMYPLYKEGQKVEIRFAHGNEPRRTYKGTFKSAGPFKIWIGREMLNKADLPELFRARFYPDLNAKARQEEIAKHRLITKFQIEKEEAAAAKAKEMLQRQFDTNCPRGWIYINDVWKRPKELVVDTLEYRKHDLKMRQANQARQAERAAEMEAEYDNGNNRGGSRDPRARARSLR